MCYVYYTLHFGIFEFIRFMLITCNIFQVGKVYLYLKSLPIAEEKGMHINVWNCIICAGHTLYLNW